MVNEYTIIVRADTFNNGRYANQFIRAMAAHFIAENLGAQPLYPPIKLVKLGIQLYKPSTSDTADNASLVSYSEQHANAKETEIISLEETNFMDFMISKQATEQIPHDMLEHHPIKILDLNNIYCQIPEHALKINDFLRKSEVMSGIKSANPYRHRYDVNNDVFIHVRLGDVPFYNPGLTYYDKILADLEFATGYITSDTINHPICLALIHKYQLQIINPHAIIEDILQLGSTCKYVVLSGGTFSWLIGVLGFHSQVYYPDPAQKRQWHGNIFECMHGWIKINY